MLDAKCQGGVRVRVNDTSLEPSRENRGNTYVRPTTTAMFTNTSITVFLLATNRKGSIR